jgi:hypothetical protein
MTPQPHACTTRRRPLAWAAACLLLAAPLPAGAQMTMRPTDKPIITAENETWYQEGEAITFSGSFYYPVGAAVFFNQNEMIRSGSYRGIPLYSLKTAEPYGVLYVPIDRGLMQPFERRREGEIAGTVGSTAPSFPVQRDLEAYGPDGGIQAQGPPMAREWTPAYDATDYRSLPVAEPAGTTGATANRPTGPLTTALKPTGLNAFYINYAGQRWFNSGKAVVLAGGNFTRTGDYHGFPVYSSSDAQSDTIYVAVAGVAGGLLTPYSTRR